MQRFYATKQNSAKQFTSKIVYFHVYKRTCSIRYRPRNFTYMVHSSISENIYLSTPDTRWIALDQT